MIRRFLLMVVIVFLTNPVFCLDTTRLRSYLSIANTTKDDSVRANNLKMAGALYVGSSPDSGILLSLRALAIAERKHFDYLIASASINLNYFYGFKGRNDSAIFYGTKAYDAAFSVRDTFRMMQALTNRGDSYRLNLQYLEALHDFQHAEQLNNAQQHPSIAAQANEGIGNVYLEQGEYARALSYYQKAKQNLKRQRGNSIWMAIENRLIGNCYMQLHHLDSAEYYLKIAIDTLVSWRDSLHLTDTYSDLGSLYLQQGRLSDGISVINNAVKNAQLYGVPLITAQAYKQLGDAYSTNGQYMMAAEAYSKGLKISSGTEEWFAIDRSNYLGLSAALKMQGDYKSSLDNFQKAYALNDSLSDRRKNEDLLRLQTMYETEKKDKEIAQLNNKLTSLILGSALLVLLLAAIFFQFYHRRKTKFKLETNQLKNKVLRSQLNPHFIFNALNSIKNYIHKHPELADEYLTRFSTLMRQVLENSVEEKIPLSEEIAMLENYMRLEEMRLPYGFDYEFIIENSVHADGVMIPPLILQPMIENAIWHGLKPLHHRGKISLRFVQTNGLLEVSIHDNGVGRNTSIKIDVPVKKRSMGMQITRDRIELMNRKSKLKGWLSQQFFEQGSQAMLAIPLSD